MQSIALQVKNTLAQTMQLTDISTIEMHHHLRKDLQMDSMSSLIFLMKLEENIQGFSVDPETLSLSDLETVSSITEYVRMQFFAKEGYVH